MSASAFSSLSTPTPKPLNNTYFKFKQKILDAAGYMDDTGKLSVDGLEMLKDAASLGAGLSQEMRDTAFQETPAQVYTQYLKIENEKRLELEEEQDKKTRTTQAFVIQTQVMEKQAIEQLEHDKQVAIRLQAVDRQMRTEIERQEKFWEEVNHFDYKNATEADVQQLCSKITQEIDRQATEQVGHIKNMLKMDDSQEKEAYKNMILAREEQGAQCYIANLHNAVDNGNSTVANHLICADTRYISNMCEAWKEEGAFDNLNPEQQITVVETYHNKLSESVKAAEQMHLPQQTTGALCTGVADVVNLVCTSNKLVSTETIDKLYSLVEQTQNAHEKTIQGEDKGINETSRAKAKLAGLRKKIEAQKQMDSQSETTNSKPIDERIAHSFLDQINANISAAEKVGTRIKEVKSTSLKQQLTEYASSGNLMTSQALRKVEELTKKAAKAYTKTVAGDSREEQALALAEIVAMRKKIGNLKTNKETHQEPTAQKQSATEPAEFRLTTTKEDVEKVLQNWQEVEKTYVGAPKVADKTVNDLVQEMDDALKDLKPAEQDTQTGSHSDLKSCLGANGQKTESAEQHAPNTVLNNNAEKCNLESDQQAYDANQFTQRSM